MEKDRALREVYPLVDGKRTQGEIAADLDTRGIAKKSAVSLKFEKLAEDYGLIQHVRRAKAGKIYRRTRLAKTLKIDTRARQGKAEDDEQLRRSKKAASGLVSDAWRDLAGGATRRTPPSPSSSALLSGAATSKVSSTPCREVS